MARLIESVLGHREIWNTLTNLLQQKRLPHGLVFVGPAGIGKKKLALALAQYALCESIDQSPCGVCPSCVRIENRQSEGLLLVNPSGATLKLEQAHEILDFLSLRSVSRSRFIVIDDAAQMMPPFANALLKILEEPPTGTHFIFLIPTASQLLPTLRSRLQAVRFFPLPDEILAAGSQAEPWMVAAAQGSFRQLEEWRSESISELKEKAIAALDGLLQGRKPAFDGLVTQVKERERAEIAAQLFQQLLRDAFFAIEGFKGLVHADKKSVLSGWGKQGGRAALLSIWRDSFQLQQDIGANLDRALSFENFFYRSRRRLEDPNAIMD